VNVYLTTGTFDYLKKIEAKYPDEMITLVNQSEALLFHETSGPTVFKQPRRYEAIAASGEIKKEGFAVMNNIPVTEEGRPLFEHLIKKQVPLVEKAEGLAALRFLRPLSSNTYIIMTVWKSEAAFNKWQNSNSFFDLKDKGFGDDGQPKIFESSSYVRKYLISE
jgi:heme-degrading monooxygenase HmoA